MQKIIFLTVFLLACLSGVRGQTASIHEEYISFPTYAFSDPDPAGRPGRIWPYFRFDGYSLLPVEQKHRMVVMENNWIKVWIAPDIGGKIWGALDKTTGKYFIYFNNVVKFREIAMRGPWTSGGIEFNFGSIGHAPTTANPVDYRCQLNGDGSVSCFLGALELSSRTEWLVEVSLPPDKAWFETRSYWNNPTNLTTSLYHWQTAAADATDDLQYYFPGNAYIDHSGNRFDWPVMKDGRDISLYRNNDYGTYHSYHVLGEYTDWFAGYYNDSQTGFGHWSRYPYKPGKKIWIWGLSRQGEIWKGLLTDSTRGNTQYTEIQTGLLFNQEADGSTLSPFKHLYLMPGSVESFRERWFPISKTGGVTSISTEGILNITKDGSGVKLSFQALGFLKNILQVADTAGKILCEFPVELNPLQIFEKQVDAKYENLVVRIKDGELLAGTGERNQSRLERPLEMLPDFNWESVYGLYTKGIEKSRQRLYNEAKEWFNKCLEKDPYYLPACTGLAEIDFREMRYDDAEKKLIRVLGFDTYDPDANFLYGTILSKKNENNKARDAFGVTLRSPGYKSASLNQLALISLKEKRLEEAWEYVQNAGLFNGMDINIYRTAIVIARLRSDWGNYNILCQRLNALDPLNHMVSFEKYYTTRDTISRNAFTAEINTELKYETFIELSLWYFNAGLQDEALELIKLSPAHPLADMLTGFLADNKGNSTDANYYLNRALIADDKLVFPFRQEYREILVWADQKHTCWKTKYYNALLYWGAGQTVIAANYFSECGDKPDSYGFYLTRGSFLKQNGGNEEADYRKAINFAGNSWRPYHLLHGYYISVNNFREALNVSQAAIRKFPGSYIIRFDHALSLMNTGKYEECVKLLANTEILPYEGAGYSRTLWRQSNLLEALRLIEKDKIGDARIKIASARLWPEKLGVGRPYLTDENFEDLLDAFCIRKTGKNDGTEILLSRVALSCSNNLTEDISSLSGSIALRSLKKPEEAEKLFMQWSEKIKDKLIKEWASDLFTDNISACEKIRTEKLLGKPDYLIIEKIYKLYSELK
jgi:tetratricopeptide (TPR) repeat protein